MPRRKKATPTTTMQNAPDQPPPTAVKTTKPRRGRPRGAKNHERGLAVSIPATCPNQSCRSTDLAKTPGQRREVKMAGTVQVMGQLITYNRITYTPAQCQACGQRCVIRDYHKD